ncbi:hypothetical protein EDC39_101232 [Geothermobacter ehrlichii]|uniref:Sulfotransferase family protein n=2 Tax=Geothermobacter ehrlichii TaxID=213224 RepID=A0A5D3WNB8_9BACT|nr:hypothetical protein EDC39_101232 [Geothermobacter ehrlichii]
MKKGAEYLGPYIVKNRKIVAISSHHIVLPLPSLPGVNIELLKMFRHPLARVLSVYSFEKRQKEQTLGAKVAQSSSFREYLAWRLSKDSPGVIRNFHVRRLLPGLMRNKEISDQEFNMAIETLEGMKYFGLVEEFDDSMILFETRLREYFPDLDFAYKAQNVGRGLPKEIDEDVSRLRAMAGEELYARLVEANRFDLELYRLARDRFSCFLNGLFELDKKRADFRRRCLALV